MIPSVEGSSICYYNIIPKIEYFVKWTSREKMTEFEVIFGELKNSAAVLLRYGKTLPQSMQIS